ncbi:MAG: hypothetical protein JNK78_20735 [Planctomycetes bacterium]|nr:hypothetical protein [Planctomycetota bacterium]
MPSPKPDLQPNPKHLAVAAWLLLSAGTALIAASMLAYPGGSCSRPDACGYDQLRNYLCDLTRPVAHNGEPNSAGMRLGRAGMIVTGLSFVPLFALLPRLFPRHAVGAASRPLGIVAALAVPSVACTPSNAHPSWHSVAIVVAGLPGCLALAAGTSGVLSVRERHPGLARLTVVMLGAALTTGALYSATFLASWPDQWLLPTAQKVAGATLVVWSAIAVRSALRSSTRAQGATVRTGRA